MPLQEDSRSPAALDPALAAIGAIAGAYLDRLRDGLLRVQVQAKTSSRHLSGRLGREESYWGRVLSGRYQAKVTEVCQVLEMLGLPTAHFFLLFFPQPAVSRGEAEKSLGALPAEVDIPKGERLAFEREAQSVWDAEEWAIRIRELLRLLLAQHRAQLPGLSLAVGLPAASLGRALRGEHRLTFRHVFTVLAGLGLPPARFFGEVAFPSRNQVDELRWSEEILPIQRRLDRLAKTQAAAGRWQPPSRPTKSEPD